jgi:hypothetical protein
MAGSMSTVSGRQRASVRLQRASGRRWEGRRGTVRVSACSARLPPAEKGCLALPPFTRVALRAAKRRVSSRSAIGRLALLPACRHPSRADESRGRGRDREGEPPGSTRSPSSALPSILLPISRSTHARSGSLASGQLPSRFSHAARLTVGPRKGKQGQQRLPRYVLSRVAPTSPADERRSAGRSLPGTVDTFDDAHRPLGRSCEHRHELDY